MNTSIYRNNLQEINYQRVWIQPGLVQKVMGTVEMLRVLGETVDVGDVVRDATQHLLQCSQISYNKAY